jgi:hypothetical protein
MGHHRVAAWQQQQGTHLRARGQSGPWNGKTALAIAREHGHDEIIELLQNAGATE